MRARASGSAPSLLLLGGSISAGATAGPNLQLHSQLARMNAVLAPGFEGDGEVPAGCPRTAVLEGTDYDQVPHRPGGDPKEAADARVCGARALTCARGGTQSGLFSTCLPDLLSSCDAFHGEAFDVVVLEFFINDDVLGSDAKLFEGLVRQLLERGSAVIVALASMNFNIKVRCQALQIGFDKMYHGNALTLALFPRFCPNEI